MTYTNPQVSDFKTYFYRDFNYGPNSNTVTNTDITNALTDASVFINPVLFNTQAIYNTGFLLLAAHFLVMSLRASSQGVNGQFPWMQSSKGVGSVSEGFTIPDRILANPEFAMLSKTYYGAKFLFMVLPQLTGVMFSVCSRTNP